MRILLVEDDPDSAEALMLLLRHAGFEVDWAPSGTEALREMDERRRSPASLPDVMIVDLMLPDMEGSELVEDLMLLGPTPPVVLHSAAPQHVLATAALRMRAVSILRKPTEFARVVDVLREIGLRQNSATVHSPPAIASHSSEVRDVRVERHFVPPAAAPPAARLLPPRRGR